MRTTKRLRELEEKVKVAGDAYEDTRAKGTLAGYRMALEDLEAVLAAAEKLEKVGARAAIRETLSGLEKLQIGRLAQALRDALAGLD